MFYGDAKKELRQRLINIGIEPQEAGCEAEIMLSSASGLDRVALVLKGPEPVPSEVEAELRAYIERRARREPLQHILGEAFFMGLRFHVGPAVLIPRPETEVLVEHASQAIMDSLDGRARILDIGAGSGAICISLLKAFPHSTALALEIDPAAADICRANARALGVEERLTVVVADFLTDIGLENYDEPEKFDLFVSNPPYIPAADIPGLAPEVKDYEPHRALIGADEDGLGFYRAFARRLPALAARPGTLLFAEFGRGQGAQIRLLFEQEEWQGLMLLRDLAGLERVLKAASPKKPL
ncbi:MAG: peptide chain release factor N(5)-glutamine methyltransferase [Cyanobacteria bacterium SZAS TMP-1]|nr:peptide chain release factor N(5)-glutamine methyltransferase [Cyanobacteria bacterium SZAS TMP-1]